MVAELFRKIFPPVHVHPMKLPYEWKQWNDPFHPLEAHEEGCGPVRTMALILDYEQHGKRKVVIQ